MTKGRETYGQLQKNSLRYETLKMEWSTTYKNIRMFTMIQKKDPTLI